MSHVLTTQHKLRHFLHQNCVLDSPDFYQIETSALFKLTWVTAIMEDNAALTAGFGNECVTHFVVVSSSLCDDRVRWIRGEIHIERDRRS